MNTKLSAACGIAMAALVPLAAYAQTNSLKGLASQVVGTVNILVALLFGIASLVFIMGVIKYLAASDPKKMTDARNYMVFSIVSLTVMVLIWSLAFLLKNSFFPNSKMFYNPVNGTVSGKP